MQLETLFRIYLNSYLSALKGFEIDKNLQLRNYYFILILNLLIYYL